VGVLVVLGILWQGWLVWAALVVFLFKVKHPPTLNDDAPIGPGRRRLGWLAILIFAMTFMPFPLREVSF
jgi:hypothetical protein